MIRIIRNKDRYHFETDWLSTYWHFSFDTYYDPKNMNFGPLRVFNDDVVQPSSGFPMHGHREMEIVTYVLEGELEHKDSTGGIGKIGSGDVQRMSAGTGIQHSEYNASTDTPVHLLQLWILPKEQGLKPGYEQKHFSLEQRQGKLLKVADSNEDGEHLKIHQDAAIYVSRLLPNQPLRHSLDADRRAYVFVIDGELVLNGETLSQGDQGRIEHEAELDFKTQKSAELILLDLP